ncbi:MAG TPA: hypothetical protein VJU78_01170, partial [Chitinophagaceae bacterium]|nr:hypothetical protein [Chitinophagaceae bacterium]
MRRLYIICFIAIAAFITPSIAQKKQKDSATTEKKDSWTKETFSGLNFRCVGPAVTSGRVVDFAVSPKNHKEYFVAAAAGGVWKTSNGGITYNPV